jgi:signal transduction histidine kinase
MDWLWSTNGFPARWYCGEGWTDEPYLGWIHIAADILTWFAYAAIPCVLAYFIVQRRDVAFPGVFWLFCGFIVSCGLVHLTEAIMFWMPVYRLSAVLKVVTAIISTVTVVALIRVLPQALRLPALASINAQLSTSQAELKTYAAKLERSNSDLSDFAYIASHDLKSPLRGIGQLASWVEEDEGEAISQEGRDNLAMLQGRVRRMEGLLSDLLSYSQIGLKDSEMEEINVAELLTDIEHLIAPPRGFKVTWDDDLPSVRAYAAPIRMVFMNLIGNAIKHAGSETGSVHVSARDFESFVEFVFKDSGPGISPEFHDEAFQLFRTLNSRDDVEGSGMGLAFVKRTMEEFGGAITLESELGQGATFTVRWPKIVAVASP